MGKKRLNSLNITAMFPPESTGGVATHVHYLAQSLSKLKTNVRHSVNILTVHNKSRGKLEVGGAPPNLIIHKLPGNNSNFDASGSIPYEQPVQYCMKLCNDPKKKPDVIHVHDFESAHIASLLKAVYKIPIILTVHKTPKEWDNTRIYNEPKNFHLQALTQLDVFDFFIAPSKAYKQHLIDHGVPDGKIKIIQHGIPKHYLQSLNDKNVFRRLNIDIDSKKIIFCPIRLERHKGPDIFIEAANIVFKKIQDKNLLFVIAGNGSEKYKNTLVNLAKSLGIDNEVLIGSPYNQPLTLSEMATLYRKAEICVLPSRREGFGQVILESFIFNTPIIGSNVGGINEVIIPEKNGLLFDRGEPEHLAEQIIRLITDKKLAKTITQNGRKDIQEKYTSEIMAKSYFKLYKKCRAI